MNIEELVRWFKRARFGDEEIRAELSKLKPGWWVFLLVVEEQPQAEQPQAVKQKDAKIEKSVFGV